MSFVYTESGEGRKVPLSLIRRDSDGDFILGRRDGDIELHFQCPLSKADQPKQSDYTIECFRRSKLTESSIFQFKIPVADENMKTPSGSLGAVNSDDIRIGWIFSILALESDQHSHANNSHFLNYALGGIYHLLHPVDSIEVGHQEMSQSASLKLSTFYGDDLAILVLSKSQLEKIENFDIRDFYVSLFRLGFVHIPHKPQLFEDDHPCQIRFKELKAILRATSISPALRSEEYFRELFSGSYPLGATALSDFLILYQAFEVFLERILEHKRLEISAQIITFSSSFSAVKGLVKLVQDELSEDRRLRILESKFISQSVDVGSFVNTAKQLFPDDLDRVGTDFVSLLYAVRNRAVHNYRSFDAPAGEKFLRLVGDMRIIVCDFARYYRENFPEYYDTQYSYYI